MPEVIDKVVLIYPCDPHNPVTVYYIKCSCGNQLHWMFEHPKKYAKCSKCGTRYDNPTLKRIHNYITVFQRV
jgi:hypothetical protein